MNTKMKFKTSSEKAGVLYQVITAFSWKNNCYMSKVAKKLPEGWTWAEIWEHKATTFDDVIDSHMTVAANYV